MHHNKTRVMDFFRRTDTDHDGKVTRQEFIDGILESSEFVFSLHEVIATERRQHETL